MSTRKLQQTSIRIEYAMPGNPVPFEETIDIPEVTIVKPLKMPNGQLDLENRTKLILGVATVPGGFALFRRIPRLAAPFDGQAVLPLQGAVKVVLKLRVGSKNVFHTAYYPFSPQNGNDQTFNTEPQIQGVNFVWFVAEAPDNTGNLFLTLQKVLIGGGPLGGICSECNTTTDSDRIRDCSLSGCY